MVSIESVFLMMDLAVKSELIIDENANSLEQSKNIYHDIWQLADPISQISKLK
jgi:hypothetical protein